MNSVFLIFSDKNQMHLVLEKVKRLSESKHGKFKILTESQNWLIKCKAPGYISEEILNLRDRVCIEILKMIKEDCIDNARDSVRFYFLCRQCLSKMEYSGIGQPPEFVSYRIC